MVKGRTIITWARATELAGRCCLGSDRLSLVAEGELLAHARGWIWAVYYACGKAVTHFVLIHPMAHRSRVQWRMIVASTGNVAENFTR